MELKNVSDYAKATEKHGQKEDSKRDKKEHGKDADTKTKYKKLVMIGFAFVLLVSIVVIVLAFIPCKTGFRIVQ